jgi:hypothetical protein
MPASLALVTVTIAALIQQVAGGADGLGGLTQFGLMGAVLGWLMLRVERRLDEIRKAHEESKDAWNRVGRAIVLLALSRDDPTMMRDQAEHLLRELDPR